MGLARTRQRQNLKPPPICRREVQVRFPKFVGRSSVLVTIQNRELPNLISCHGRHRTGNAETEVNRRGGGMPSASAAVPFCGGCGIQGGGGLCNGPREAGPSRSMSSPGFSGRVVLPVVGSQFPRISRSRGNLSHFGGSGTELGTARGAPTVRVSTSPAAETDRRRIHYASEEEDEEGGLGFAEELPADLVPDLMPRHVALIMDGNARWAEGRGVHMSVGHAAGAESLKKVARAASRWGVKVLTIFAFSTDNWRRPQVEVDFLMQIFERQLQTEMRTLMRYSLRLRFIGDISTLPLGVQKAIKSAEERTRRNEGMIINVCMSYSGRADLVQACQLLATEVAEGKLNPKDIDDSTIARRVVLSELGELQDPDLVIRTSGEQRISNFLLWQVAYSEFIFVDPLWPDFGKEDFRAALVTYQQRNRRYGIRHA